MEAAEIPPGNFPVRNLPEQNRLFNCTPSLSLSAKSSNMLTSWLLHMSPIVPAWQVIYTFIRVVSFQIAVSENSDGTVGTN